MRQQSVAIALILLLIAPLNVDAAAWMAMPTVDGGNHASAAADHTANPLAGQKPGQQVERNGEHQSLGHSKAVVHESHGAHANHSGAHDQHSDEDCQEYCLSCSNHCSSLAVFSSHAASFTQTRVLSSASDDVSSYHSDLLFRPPISA